MLVQLADITSVRIHLLFRVVAIGQLIMQTGKPLGILCHDLK